MTDVIQLHRLTKLYGSSVGVRNVSLSVPKGSVFGFLGPNGAGKTTTISMLVDFIRPTSGSVKLFGLDAREQATEIHRRIGFLAGDMAMDRGLTGWQQLEYLGNLRGNFDKAYVRELAKRLDCNLNRKFKKLSRGNRQKVGLIAALMHRPELLILDEPTSGLDPLIQAEFNKIILEHQAAGGTTFISSHVLSEVQEICDTAAFIRQGKIVDIKPIADLTKQAPKQFRLTGATPELIDKLGQLKGLVIVKDGGQQLSGTYQGDVNRLLKLLSQYKLTDFTFQEPDLESLFMKYYEGDSHA